MIGFTLSKLNLLILVTAVFSIVVYFMFGLTDVVIGNSAQQMVTAYSETSAHIITSDALCFQTEITVPAHISYFGGSQQPKRFFYFMNISRFPKTFDPNELTSVIFSVTDTKDETKLRAASSVDVNAEVLLYDWDPGTRDLSLAPVSEIVLDPQSAVSRKDSFVIVKEIINGKNYLHIIACSSDGACKINFDKVGCSLRSVGGRGAIPFCFFKDADEVADKC